MAPRLRKWLPRLAPLLPLLLLASLMMLSVSRYSAESGAKPVPYSELLAAVTAGQVKEAEIEPERINATLRAAGSNPETRIVAERLPNVDDQRLLQALESHGVVVRGKTPPSTLSALWWALVPLGVFFLLWSGSRAGTPGRAGALGVGRSRARITDQAAANATTFADVAGVDEAKAELVEVVKFLKEPTAYTKVGAHVPKGVLLVGAPGTGKTLLAKAVAGEAGVPFFSISGSEFVEMFVGVGASRVRDLFEQAKGRAPAIIFIDELDAVGKARSGVQGFVANEEREQTLNQLLVEMDGFDSGRGLVVLAATNRPEILDRALLRAGRFDRQVVVDRPDVKGRQAILQVHARKVALGVDVDLDAVAHRTPGMVGSDLANVVNEAALAAVRRASVKVDAVDFEEAVDRIQLGLRKEGRIMSADEKRRVAYHEAGHALVALSMKHADPVHRVTIIPRSVGALGATLQLPAEERYLMTRDELLDRICVLLGGRASEEIACEDVSTGAADDLERATELARQMICRFGMSEGIGVVTVVGRPVAGWHEPASLPGASEASLRLIDRETTRLVDAARERAKGHLVARRPALDALAAELLARETLQRTDLERIVREAESAGSPARRPANLVRLHAG